MGTGSEAISIQTAEQQPTAVVAISTTWARFPSEWKPALDEVWALLQATDGLRADGHNVMLYLDAVPNVEVGVQVVRTFEPHGRVRPSVLPAGRIATAVHRGDYGGLGATHAAVRAWCDEHGHELVGPSWEIYGDWCEDPNQLETQVCWLLRP